MKITPRLLLPFFVSLSSFGMDIYISPDKKTYIHYNEETDSYNWEVRGKKYAYPRRSYDRMFKRHIFDLPEDKMKQLKTLVEAHSLHKKLSRPTPEDHLERAFDMRDDAIAIASNELVPCEGKTSFKTKRYDMKMKLDEKTRKKVDHEIIQAKMHEDGFVPFGGLKRMNVQLNTQNDNAFHGALRGLGVTEFNEGIEGDDRGFTVGGDATVELEFEKGSVALRKYSKGYSRLKPQAKMFGFGGRTYSTYFKKDKDGAFYQEFLNIDGLEIEIKHEIGYKDIYFKVVGRKETLDDQSGLASSMQKTWHEKFGGTKYNNVDYRDKEKRSSAGIALGQKLSLYEGDNVAVRADYSVERQFSTGGDSDNYYGADASVSFQWNEAGKGGHEYASWDATVYGGHKRYLDNVSDTRYGIDITKGFQVTENNFFYVTYGASMEDDRVNRAYSSEAIDDDGGLEGTHHLNMKWEYRFK